MIGPDEYPEAEEGDFISGIFNYCDRWCERCPMTMKCRQYAMEATMDALGGGLEEADGNDRDDDLNAEFWKRVEENLDKTLGMIDEKSEALEPEFRVSDFELESEIEEEMGREEQKELEDRKHSVSVESMAYLDRVEPWFKTAADLLLEKGVDLEGLAQRKSPKDGYSKEARELHEAVEVILWYHMHSFVKLQRALGSQRHEREEDWDFMDDPEWQSDADGSAKVAILGIDRSLSAWGTMRDCLPVREEEIFEIMLQLDRIRRLTERQFPKAREFKRPGFDD